MAASDLVQSLLLVFRPTLTKIDALTLDANLSENHQYQVDVTEHPVEEGIDITDHAQPKPDVVTIEGLISNTPLNQASLAARLAALPSTLATLPAALAQAKQNLLAGNSPFPESPDYVKLALEQLIDLKNSRKMITIVTTLRTYQNMMLTNLTIPRDYKTGDALRFTAVFKQVRVVQVKQATITAKAAPKKKKGTKPTAQATPQQVHKSILKSGADTQLGNSFLHAIGWR